MHDDRIDFFRIAFVAALGMTVKQSREHCGAAAVSRFPFASVAGDLEELFDVIQPMYYRRWATTFEMNPIFYA